MRKIYVIACKFRYINVYESVILGPKGYFSDIEKLVSFERAMFEDYSFK